MEIEFIFASDQPPDFKKIKVGVREEEDTRERGEIWVYIHVHSLLYYVF